VRFAAATAVPAGPDVVYAALLDPEVLRRAIPGCVALTPAGGDAYRVDLQVGFAGVKGRYSGTVTVRERRPPEAIALAFEGKGSPGFVRGTATLHLAPVGGQTAVTSEADVQVGGPVAAVGSRLIEAAARWLADEFFRRLAEESERAARVTGG
jgi:carbon monoxide dehydrogenase subunit G